ncbi:Putative pentatricopeptide repeat-containing protein [Apostasia shenzhenica]|uniref:Pentatricopeptide repeat-containing protein n=1 Tax=Apostasia shenzhenica TaxID=1088818 RepID=A0A2I0AGI9_9ASPA|nr:Putative pentatricopeptide repeat-containing protein [Apostasia shenzhenica]
MKFLKCQIQCQMNKKIFQQFFGPIRKAHFAGPPPPISPLAAATSLIKSYFDRGLLSDARRVFDEMPERDVVTWTAMIYGYASNSHHHDAWSAFRAMAAAGFSPNEFTLSSVLTACRAMEFAAVVHAVAFRRGVEGSSYVGNALLSAYAACGGIGDALKLFDEIPQRSDAMWTTIIAAYVQWGDAHAAVNMCCRMFQEFTELNPFTLSISLRASSAAGSLTLGKQIHGIAVKTGHTSDLPVSNAIIDLYSRCNSLLESRQYFNEMPQKNLITWNTMISALDRFGSIEACHLLVDMYLQSFKPNCFTFTSVISTCANLSILSLGLQVHAALLQRGFGTNQQMANALVNMYAKCGNIADSQKIFDEMSDRDLLSWTSLINGYGVNGFAKVAIELFEEMIRSGIKPDSVAFLALISACSHAGLIEEGVNLFSLMEIKHGVRPDIEVYGCIIDLLGRRRRLREAYELIEMMPIEADESTWGALLGACHIHGEVELGRLAAEKIMKMKPNGGKTYVILSNIYAARSELTDSAEMRKMMRDAGRIKEAGISSIELREEIYNFVAGDRSNPCVVLASEVLEMLIYHIEEMGEMDGSDWMHENMENVNDDYF